MSTTTILAIGTSVVAIASLIFSYLSASRDRRATLDLTRESHAHEIDVRKRERAYDARTEAYRTVLRWALVTMQQVQLTDKVWKPAGTPDPPDNVSQELFDTLHIEVALFGSPEVKQQIEEFRDAADSFFRKNKLATMTQNQDVSAEKGVEALLERDRARERAREGFDELEAEINTDLATL